MILHASIYSMLSNNVIIGFSQIEFPSSQIPSSWHLFSLSDPLTSSVGATLWRPLVQGHFDKLSTFLWRSSHHTEVIFLSVTLPYTVKLPRKYHFPCERFSNSQLLSWYDKKQSLEKSCMCTSWKGSRATLSLTLANHHPKILQWELMQCCKILRDGYNERIQQNILVWFSMKIWFQKYFPIGITKKALSK